MLKRIMRPVVGVARQNGVTSHAPNDHETTLHEQPRLFHGLRL
jgi:hypothetical protein